MPELVRLYIRQVVIGFGIAGVFVGLLLALDVAGLRGLVWRSPDGWLALFLLFFFNGLVFAGVQFAISVMGMAEPKRGGPSAGQRLLAWVQRGRDAAIVPEATPAAAPVRPEDRSQPKA
jgi:hypothetical protein